MPEGDTIFRAARRMNLALVGQKVTGFRSVFPQLLRVDEDAPLTGRTVEEVSAVGKHLLIRFSGELVLRTHMRMNGSWHLYRPGERWRRSEYSMRIVIETEAFVAVGFNVPVAEFIDAETVKRRGEVARLGPDVLSPTFDREEAVRRIAARPELEIAEALLNQRLIAGIGNVFKSEILFVCGVSPFRRVLALNAGTVENLVETAVRLLRLNVSPDDQQTDDVTGRFTTGRLDPEEKLWVYGRRGRPCLRCGTAIERRAQGPDARLTYWCPHCQE